MQEELEKYEMAKKIYAETFAAIAGRVAYEGEYTPDYVDMSYVAREMTEAAVAEFFDWDPSWWESLGSRGGTNE